MNYTNRFVAELFAKGKRKGSSKHMFIEGDYIFSYGHHFPIAKRQKTINLEKLGMGKRKRAIFTTDSYSHTTAIHKQRVLGALIDAGYSVRHVSEKVMKRGKRVFGW